MTASAIATEKAAEFQRLTVNVLRFAGYPDCTRRGLTSRRECLDLYFGDGALEVAPDDALVLVADDPSYLYAVPAGLMRAKRWTIAGGNFVHTSDGRFPNRYPIPVHDRVEG